ncbi:hypothetical protein L9F63_002552, partial [Diploptera punctata]
KHKLQQLFSLENTKHGAETKTLFQTRSTSHLVNTTHHSNGLCDADTKIINGSTPNFLLELQSTIIIIYNTFPFGNLNSLICNIFSVYQAEENALVYCTN